MVIISRNFEPYGHPKQSTLSCQTAPGLWFKSTYRLHHAGAVILGIKTPEREKGG